MSSKKIMIIASLAIAFGVVITFSVGSLIWLTLYSMGNSDAATAAQTFLRNNEKLKQEIGEVKDFGSLVTSSINSHNADGEATLKLKVIGARKTVNASVDLIYRKGKSWRVTGASYTDDAGKTVELLNPYDSQGLRILNFRSRSSQSLNLRFSTSRSESISRSWFNSTDRSERFEISCLV